ncbi:hypothetical protein [Acinetobacter sp. P1(2025)]|uniref:hypothetical protein n=1 Tax=Acinetobacter sp. P1(2025) TaxID=3446120 RepID=UPI003F52ACE4
MSNSNSAFLIISPVYLDVVFNLLKQCHKQFELIDSPTNNPILRSLIHNDVVIEFKEIFFGSLFEESTLLIFNKIPHTVYWLGGDNYQSGTVTYKSDNFGSIVRC